MSNKTYTVNNDRTCTFCGASLKIDETICPVCGTEYPVSTGQETEHMHQTPIRPVPMPEEDLLAHQLLYGPPPMPDENDFRARQPLYGPPPTVTEEPKKKRKGLFSLFGKKNESDDDE